VATGAVRGQVEPVLPSAGHLAEDATLSDPDVML
jgi:hypothetical protein